MNNKTERVFNGWLALTPVERAEFDKAVREFNAGSSFKQEEVRKSLREHLNKMQTGPLGSACACCGR